MNHASPGLSDRPAAPPTPLPQSGAPGTQELARRIGRLVARNATRWKFLIVAEGLGLLVSAVLGYLWTVFLLDNFFYLPVVGRLLASVALFAIVCGLLVWIVGRWRRLSFTPDQVALAMEVNTPGGVQNRLINALQIARDNPHATADFNEAAVLENWQKLQQIDLQHASAMRPAVVRTSLAFMLMVFGLVFWLAQPAKFANAATRIFLPFAAVDPLYRTILTVEPGDMEAIGDATISIRIQGERPAELRVLQNVQGTRTSERVPVDARGDTVQFTFHGVERSFSYSVQGGDFTSPVYRVEVPTPSNLSLVRVTYHYPDYTRLPEKQLESAGGDLEGLRGTRASVTFVFDRPAEEAAILLHRTADGGKAAEPAAQPPVHARLPLTKVSDTEFRGEVALENLAGYQLETRQPKRSPHVGPVHTIVVLDDQAPKLELTGLDRQTEGTVDTVLPVKISATDDYGLTKVGVFVRRVDQSDAEKAEGNVRPAEKTDKNAGSKEKKDKIARPAAKDDWVAVEVWQANHKLEFRQPFDLSLLSIGAVEGERLEVALRAADADPRKGDGWTTGTAYGVLIGGEGVALQFQYEQILQTETDMKGILSGQQKGMQKAAEWVRNFDADSGLRWDDPKNVTALNAAMQEQARDQDKLRQTASRTARNMVAQAGSLRLSLGMLADTEMIRSIRILESVASRDDAGLMRSALADGRLTQERIVRSLQEILEQYVKFRQDWELAHMIPFVRMLADRQLGLRDGSLRHAGLAKDPSAELRQKSSSRRQAKVLELCGKSHVAFAGLAERTTSLSPILSRGFALAAESLNSSELKQRMQQAADRAAQGQWTQVAADQTRAAEMLDAIHAGLRKAQLEAAQQALAALMEKAESDLETQKLIEKLKAGSDQAFVDIASKLSLEDIIHMREVAEKKKTGGDDTPPYVENYLFPDSAKGMLQQADKGIRQEFKNLSLADAPGKTPSFPKQSDREANKVVPHLQEKFDDLVGELLEEADEMNEKYETYNLNAAFNINEIGNVGKQAGDLNSTAASAATGNMKPPTTNVGGASRAGRRGARAHGLVMGDESVNRRGRDKVQEGQERVADQAGTIKETKSDDMQKDTSTGIGGKKVESDDSKFSLADAGKWTDDMAGRMDKPQAKNSIVERQDGKIDARVAEMLKDLTGNQEQIIERLKTIRKELKNLYLPTDHLDELTAQLAANLASLKERPDAEVFRKQQQTIERLRSALKVLHQAHSGFQPSVPREQALQGRILDEPARAALPGYEEAVKRYYEKLTAK